VIVNFIIWKDCFTFWFKDNFTI